MGCAARAFGLVWLAVLWAAPAHAQLRVPEPAVVFELSALGANGLAPPSPSRWRRDGASGFDRLDEPGQVRARWWWRAGRLDVGTGTDLTTDGAMQPLASRPVLGLRTDVSTSTRFVYELRRSERSAGASMADAPDRDMRLALEFQPVNVSKQYARGLLRIELSSGSTLSLRPRGGGLAMTWQSRF